MNAAKNNVCDAPRHDDVEAPAASKSPARASSSDDAYGGMLGYVLGLFVFYVGHDALQEHNFRREGFKFGWFMTCVEIGTMFACALIWEGGAAAFSGGSKDAAAPEDVAARRWYLVGLVFVIALSQGTGSVALQHVNYPVKVAFKSCKLVPTMLFSQCVNKSSYGTQEYAAAALMCLALALLGLADAAHATHATHAYGLLLLVVAVCSDAVVPNFQEKLLRGLKMPLGTMVIYSNAGSFALVLAYVSFTGELARAVASERRVSTTSGSRRRRGCDVDLARAGRRDASAAARIVRERVAATPRPHKRVAATPRR